VKQVIPSHYGTFPPIVGTQKMLRQEPSKRHYQKSLKQPGKTLNIDDRTTDHDIIWSVVCRLRRFVANAFSGSGVRVRYKWKPSSILVELQRPVGISGRPHTEGRSSHP